MQTITEINQTVTEPSSIEPQDSITETGVTTGQKSFQNTSRGVTEPQIMEQAAEQPMQPTNQQQNGLIPMSDAEFGGVYNGLLEKGLNAAQIERVMLQAGISEDRIPKIKEQHRLQFAQKNYNSALTIEQEKSDNHSNLVFDAAKMMQNGDLPSYQQIDFVSDLLTKATKLNPIQTRHSNDLYAFFGDEQSQKKLAEAQEISTQGIIDTMKNSYNIDLKKNKFGDWVFLNEQSQERNVDESFWNSLKESRNEIVGDMVGSAVGATLPAAAMRMFGMRMLMGGALTLNPAALLAGGALTVGSMMYVGMKGAEYGNETDFLRLAMETNSKVDKDKLAASKLNAEQSSYVLGAASNIVTRGFVKLFPKKTLNAVVHKGKEYVSGLVASQETQAVQYATSLAGIRRNPLNPDKIASTPKLQNYARDITEQNFDDLTPNEQASIVMFTHPQSINQLDRLVSTNPKAVAIFRKQISNRMKSNLNFFETNVGKFSDDTELMNTYKQLVEQANGDMMSQFGLMMGKFKVRAKEFENSGGSYDLDIVGIKSKLIDLSTNSKDEKVRAALSSSLLDDFLPPPVKPVLPILTVQALRPSPPKPEVRFDKIEELYAIRKLLNKAIRNKPKSELQELRSLAALVKNEMNRVARTVDPSGELIEQIEDTYAQYTKFSNAKDKPLYKDIFAARSKSTDLEYKTGTNKNPFTVGDAVDIIEKNYYEANDTVELLKHINKIQPDFAQKLEMTLLLRKLNSPKYLKVEDGESFYEFQKFIYDQKIKSSRGRPQFIAETTEAAYKDIEYFAEAYDSDPYLFFRRVSINGEDGVASLGTTFTGKSEMVLTKKLFDHITTYSPYLNKNSRNKAIKDVGLRFIADPVNFKNAREMEIINQKFSIFSPEDVLNLIKSKTRKTKEKALRYKKALTPIVKTGKDFTKYSQIHRAIPVALLKMWHPNYTLKDFWGTSEGKQMQTYLSLHGYKYIVDDNGKMTEIPKNKDKK